MVKLSFLLVAAALLSSTTSAQVLKRNGIAKQMKMARARGDSPEQLKQLRKELVEKLKVARAGGLSFETVNQATERGADIQDIKSEINKKNLQKMKKKGFLKKKEASLNDILFPGVSPIDYEVGSDIDMVVDTVNSAQTGIPFLYYNLPVCEPENVYISDRKRKNLGERLAGKSVAMRSPYKLTVKQNTGCQPVCRDPVNFRPRELKRMIKLVQRKYKANFSLDGLPLQVAVASSRTVSRGYPLGARIIDESSDVTEYVYHNHVRFNIKYNELEGSPGTVRIVGFEAKPISIKHDPKNLLKTCSPDVRVRTTKDTLLHLKMPNKRAADFSVTYTYEVNWVKTSTSWTDRWDIYLLGRTDENSIHHMSILNSIMIVLFLGTVSIVVLVRNLRKDLAVYNFDVEMDEDEEDSGWKLVHGDVFRPPSTKPMALAVFVGTGIQIAVSLFATLVMAQTHLINPVMKGRALSTIIMTYALSGSVGGYISARIFKFTGGKNWKLNTIYTAMFFPGMLMSLFLALNIFLTLYGSAKSVRVFTIISAFAIWICVASPMVFIGSFLGFKRDPIEVPTRTNQIARVVPPAGPFFSNPLCHVAFGVLPFSTVCVEIYFIMGAIWLHQYYMLMGYLLVILACLAITSALLATITTYVRLCHEDHRWWWKSFADSASSGIWFFLYSGWFIFSRLQYKGLLPFAVFFTYTSMMAVAMSLYCGSVGFLTAMWFNKKIYGTVKLD
jgi:transmembrane 9 superfamily protein 2/4